MQRGLDDPEVPASPDPQLRLFPTQTYPAWLTCQGVACWNSTAGSEGWIGAGPFSCGPEDSAIRVPPSPPILGPFRALSSCPSVCSGHFPLQVFLEPQQSLALGGWAELDCCACVLFHYWLPCAGMGETTQMSAWSLSRTGHHGKGHLCFIVQQRPLWG